MKQNINVINKTQNSLNNIKERIKYLKYNGKPFEYIISGSQHQLTSDNWDSKYNTNRISVEDLMFIQKVRREVLSSKKALDLNTVINRPKNIEYIKINKNIDEDEIDNVYEIDINRAYWDAAYLLGYLNKELWEEGCEKDKVLRLMSLGGLAKKTYTLIYDPNNTPPEKIHTNNSPYQYIWYTICATISEIMKNIAAACGDKLILFWVDAVIFKYDKKIAGEIKAILNSYGYDFKENKIDLVKYTQKGYIEVFDKKHENPRKFTLPNGRKSVVKLLNEISDNNNHEAYYFTTK
jgi:hypothetical protein